MDLITLATSVEADSSVGFTVTVIVAGLGIVLATLAVLIIVFRAFGFIMEKSQANAKKKAAEKQQEKMEANLKKVSAPQKEQKVSTNAPAPSVEQGISGEVVAAITAAVYTMEGNGATVRSITKKKSPITARNPWAQAAIVDNTRPF